MQQGRDSYLSLFIELMTALWRRIARPGRVSWRRSWIYRLQLQGRMPDRILIQPPDFSSRRLEDANALLRGKFRFAGETASAGDGSIFDQPPPSAAWAEALHGFGWLASLASAGGEAGRALAIRLIGEWLDRHSRYSEPVWRADVLAARLIHLFQHGRFALARCEVMWRSRLLVSLREQSRMLARISKETPEGVPRLEAAAAHALSGVCLNDNRRLVSGLERLDAEIARQVLPDGGHVSRSPQALLDAYRLLATVTGVLERADHDIPVALHSACDRMAPMLRFFRLGDGALVMFNGGQEGEGKAIANLLARDDVRGQPFAFAPHSGYQRLAAGRTLLVMDCGTAPPGAFAGVAHAGCLSFEFSAGHQRVVVNCGASSDQAKWGPVLRATAAHSTVTLADRSMAAILSGRLAALLGPRLRGGPDAIETHRQETATGWTVEASHNGYVPLFGISHRRRLTLSPAGSLLSGSDRLSPLTRRRDAVPFAARFHIHPDVRVSASQGGGAILKLPSGEGWRFQASGGELAIEKSVYVANETVRRTEQLVVSGVVRNEPVELGWVLERFGTS